jgi:hypothetical protein
MLGGQPEVWQRVWDDSSKYADLEHRIQDARTAIQSLSSSGRGTAALCQHVGFGPLIQIPTLIHGDGSPPDRLLYRVQHHPTARAAGGFSCGEYAGIIGGAPARWYVMPGDTRTEQEMQQAHSTLVQEVARQCHRRDEALRSSKAHLGKTVKNTDMSVDVYLPPTSFAKFPPSQHTKIFRRGVELALKGFKLPLALAERAEWRVRPLAEAPPCEACGWCVDDL